MIRIQVWNLTVLTAEQFCNFAVLAVRNCRSENTTLALAKTITAPAVTPSLSLSVTMTLFLSLTLNPTILCMPDIRGPIFKKILGQT